MKKLLVSLFCVVVLTTGLSAGEKNLGLFPLCFEIGGDRPGAPVFKVYTLVDPVTKTLTGHGEITWTVNPPLDLKTNLRGDFTYMTVMPKATHILIVLTGYPVIKWPPHAGVGPVLLPNVHARIVVSEDWKKGTAYYNFVDKNGIWHEIDNAPVRPLECFEKK